MAYTISTHNGHQVARQHNLRNRKITEKESHINPYGEYAIWADIPLNEAYAKIFGNALKEYNQRQKEKGHSERQIVNYLDKIKNDHKKNPVYEMIVSIGSFDNHPDHKTSRKILNEFCHGWKERNPQLVMVGAYYHADEATPHVHIDYIPVAKDLKRGMKIQNALVKALNQMGYYTENIHNTAQVKWERSENAALEEICKNHGLEIVHPYKEQQKHLEIKEFRQLKRTEELKQKNKALINEINSLVDHHNSLCDTIAELESGASSIAHEIVLNEQLKIDRER